MVIFLQLGNHVKCIVSSVVTLFWKWNGEAGSHWHRVVYSDVINDLFWPASTRKLWLCGWCCCCYKSLCMVSSQASLGIVYTMSTEIRAALCAESARAVCSVSVLCECGCTPARQDQIWAVCNWLAPPWAPLLSWGTGEVWSQSTCSMSTTRTSLFNLAEPTLTLAQPLGCSPSLQQEEDYL